MSGPGWNMGLEESRAIAAVAGEREKARKNLFFIIDKRWDLL